MTCIVTDIQLSSCSARRVFGSETSWGTPAAVRYVRSMGVKARIDWEDGEFESN